MKNNYIRFSDLPSNDIIPILDRALEFKSGAISTSLRDKTAVLLFEKPSLRTKLSFWRGIKLLGGNPIYFGPEEVGFGKRESIKDIAKVISQLSDLVVIRTFEDSSLDTFASASEIPVINGLSNGEHPCQALADLLTIYEKNSALHDIKVAFIGDANNVAKSLAYGIAGVGGTLNIASPNGYGLKEDVLHSIENYGSGSVNQMEQPIIAVRNADFVYTDVWTSMGQESEMEKRAEDFRDYQVTPNLLKKAKPSVKFMHDMPAHDGEEISEGLLYDERSIVFTQAENRLWAQVALMDVRFNRERKF